MGPIKAICEYLDCKLSLSHWDMKPVLPLADGSEGWSGSVQPHIYASETIIRLSLSFGSAFTPPPPPVSDSDGATPPRL